MRRLILARRPFRLVAVLKAIVGRAMGREFALRITPKGGGDQKRPPMRIAATATITGLLVAVGTILTLREPALMDPNGRNLGPQRTVVALPVDRQFLGAYDPKGAITQPLDAEEVFIALTPTSSDSLKTQVRRILRLGRVPIVTLEPWPWETDGMTRQTLLTDLTVGRYDAAIQRVARTMNSFAPQVIYLRFAQEMDLGAIFPWAQGNPSAFIAAWQHFVQKFRAANGQKNVRIMWSPTGHGSSHLYYPGGDFVDVIGCTALAAEEWIPVVGPVESFADMVRDPYTFASRVGKLLIVAETGISAKDPALRMQWLERARAAMPRLPLLQGVVYFDARNPAANTPPGTQGGADWTLSSAERTAFFVPQIKR